ncbi:Peptidase S8/S53 domain containing protein [Rhypophila decipiens]
MRFLRGPVWLSYALLFGASQAIFAPSADECLPGEYWCEDRCGSDSYGEACCQAPGLVDKHHLCGRWNTCCGAGCCLIGSTCTENGECVDSGAPSGPGSPPHAPPGLPGPSSGVLTSVLPGGSTVVIIDGTTTIPVPNVAFPTTVTTDGHTITINPPGSVFPVQPGLATSVNPDGHTVISNTAGVVTVPTGITTPIEFTQSNGDVITFLPPGVDTNPTTTVDPDGQTIISNTGGVVTVPTGITTPIEFTNSNGGVITFVPGPNGGSATPGTDFTTTVDPDGQTVISNTGGGITIPTGITTPIEFTQSNGVVLTFVPALPSSLPSSSRPSGPDLTTTVDPDGQTVISNMGGIFTIPTSISGPVTLTNSAGQTITFDPSQIASSNSVVPPIVTSVDPDGHTVISNPGGDVITIPTDITTPTVITGTDGSVATFTHVFPVTRPTGELRPIETPIEDPGRSDDGGTKIPCTMWFFFVCIRWEGFDFFGWEFNLPPGPYPPGPPPPFDPALSISVRGGPLPDWPEFTIGPDGNPTFPPKPTNGPEGECETKSAELCLTRTSFGMTISDGATMTTTTAVLSTCATVFGCNVQDASVTATSTGGCTSASTVTDIWVSCPATATTDCSTTRTSLVSGCSVTPTTVTCGILTPTGVARDPSCDPVSEYVVYSSEVGRLGEGAENVTSTLRDFTGDPAKIKSESAGDLGIMFWIVNLTESQVAVLRRNPNIYSLTLTCTGETCPDPSLSVVSQEEAEDNLALLSWPPNERSVKRVSDLKNKYYFEEHDDLEEENDGDPHVYILDSGASITHEEFASSAVNFQFRHIDQDFDGTRPGNDGGYNGHGTSMLSVVAGQSLGVMKSGRVTIVRMPRRDDSGIARPEDYLTGLANIMDEFTARRASRPPSQSPNEPPPLRTILLMALQWDQREITGDLTGHRVWMQKLICHLEAEGVLVVTGAGNRANALISIEGWPAIFGNPNDPVNYCPNVLVVGGEDIKVADHIIGDGRNTRLARGTSEASAHVAGLAGYFLRLSRGGKLSNVPRTVVGFKEHIINTAWERPEAMRILRQREGDGVDLLEWRGILNVVANGVAVDHRNVCRWRKAIGLTEQLAEELEQNGSDAVEGGPDPVGDVCSIAFPSTVTITPTGTGASGPLTGLPKLPPISGTGLPPIETTRTGSSCASTTTGTQCIQGPGGRVACTPVAACASWAPTPTPTPVVKTARPVCDKESDHPKHGDIQSADQEKFAAEFCTKHINQEYSGFNPRAMTSANTDILRRYVDRHGVTYSYSVQWIRGCTEFATMDILTPAPNEGCWWMLHRTYLDCNNGGVGGYHEVGCLRYTFREGDRLVTIPMLPW